VEQATPYRLFTSANANEGPQPLVLLLHGGGQGANGTDTPIRWQNNAYFAYPHVQEDYPSYVMIPAGLNGWTTDAFDNLKSAIDGLIAEGKVDSDRVYITGSSMGGGGTWNFIQRYPEYFAAAVPIAMPGPSPTETDPDGYIEVLKTYADLPIWHFVTVWDEVGNIYENTINNNAKYPDYLSNYHLTVFDENYVEETQDGYPIDWTWAPHAEWLRAYENTFTKDTGKDTDVPDEFLVGEGRLVDWLFAQSLPTN
jgi:predicted peptidase